MKGKPSSGAEVIRFNRVLLEEIFGDSLRGLDDLRLEAIYNDLEERPPRAALCLSGGGIRSATFGLGILQGLAKKEVLQEFDYLSTVSGGGYIGSWLGAWLHHQGNNDRKVFEDLKSRTHTSAISREPKEIEHLRAYSNYLAPKRGFMSLDFWVLVGTYLRNLLLNWLVFIPVLLAFCAIPRLCVFLPKASPTLPVMSWLFWSGLALATGAIAYASTRHPEAIRGLRATHRVRQQIALDFIRSRSQGDFLRWCLSPLCLSALLLTSFWYYYYTSGMKFESVLIFASDDREPRCLNYILLGVLVHTLAWVYGHTSLFLRTRALVKTGWPVVEVCTGALGGILVWLIAKVAFDQVMTRAGLENFPLWYTCLAVPSFLMVILISGTVFVGLSSRWTTDEDR